MDPRECCNWFYLGILVHRAIIPCTLALATGDGYFGPISKLECGASVRANHRAE